MVHAEARYSIGLAWLAFACTLLTLLSVHLQLAAVSLAYLKYLAVLPLAYSVWVTRRDHVKGGRYLASWLAGYLILMAIQFHGVSVLVPEIPNSNFLRGLPADNIIPLQFAEAMLRGTPMTQGDWLGSDRPPLLSGLFLLSSLPLPLAAQYIPIGTAIQSLIFPIAVTLVERLLNRALSGFETFVTVAILVGTPLVLHNISFLWPKILAAALLLAAIQLLTLVRRDQQVWLGVAVLTAAAYLSHGASAFFIIAIALANASEVRKDSIKPILLSLLSFLLLLTPWMIYQRVVQPPGDRLLKWHLANQIDITEESFAEVYSAYLSSLTWGDYWTKFSDAFAFHLGSALAHLADPSGFFFAKVFIEQSFFKIPWSLGYLGPIFLLVTLGCAVLTANSAVRRSSITAILGVLTWVALKAGTWSLHESSYAPMFLFLLIPLSQVFCLGFRYKIPAMLVSLVCALLVISSFVSLRPVAFPAPTDWSLLRELHRPAWTRSFPQCGADNPVTRKVGFQILGTFSKGDSDTCTVHLEVTGTDSILVRTGPSIENIRITAVGQKNGPIEIVSYVLSAWHEVRLDRYFDPTEPVTVTLIDSGSGWGEWGAIAVKSASPACCSGSLFPTKRS